jgi:SPP1 gp7 family putative phage head morphogenesis protein
MGKMEPSPWAKSERIEIGYKSSLVRLSKEIQRIIDTYDYQTPQGDAAMQAALLQYSKILEPWALKEAVKLWEALNKQDMTMWQRNAIAINKGLRKVVEQTPVGFEMQAFIKSQVDLIKSLPTEAGLRAQTLAREAMIKGERPDAIIKQIQELGNLSEGRARRIARTEISRAQSVLTQERAKAIGADSYVWSTMRDGTHYKNGRYSSGVRPSHAHMQGKVCSLHNPPEVEPGKFYHCGQTYNCRCFMEILVPDTSLYAFYNRQAA